MEKKVDPSMQEDTEKTKKSGKKKLYAKIVALALCCSLLGGILGGSVVFVVGNAFAEKEMTEVIEDNIEHVIEKQIRLRNPILFRFGNTKEFIEENVLKESYIGVSVIDAADPKGAMIEAVEKGSPADRVSLQSGDVVTMVDYVKINSGSDLARIISKADVGDELLLTVCRQEETFDCTVTVGEHSRFWD